MLTGCKQIVNEGFQAEYLIDEVVNQHVVLNDPSLQLLIVHHVLGEERERGRGGEGEGEGEGVGGRERERDQWTANII